MVGPVEAPVIMDRLLEGLVMRLKGLSEVEGCIDINKVFMSVLHLNYDVCTILQCHV